MESKKISLSVDYTSSEGSNVKKGIFLGGVDEPTLNHFGVWVDDLEEFNFEKDDFEIIGNQINIKGDAKSLFNLGKYLIGISCFETPDEDYHEHISDLEPVEGKSKSEIVIHRVGGSLDI